METIKKYYGLLLLAFFAFAAGSCSSDDDGPSGTKITYRIESDTNMVTGIAYRYSDGNIINVNSASTQWSKAVIVDAPFEATLTVIFNNTTDTAQNYRLSIFEDGELAESQDGTVAASSQKTDTASHSVTD